MSTLAHVERKRNKIGNNHLIGLSVYNNRRARGKNRYGEERKKKCEFYVFE